MAKGSWPMKSPYVFWPSVNKSRKHIPCRLKSGMGCSWIVLASSFLMTSCSASDDAKHVSIIEVNSSRSVNDILTCVYATRYFIDNRFSQVILGRSVMQLGMVYISPQGSTLVVGQRRGGSFLSFKGDIAADIGDPVQLKRCAG
jgi:hypothetical protein